MICRPASGSAADPAQQLAAWSRAGFDIWMLGVEASFVIAARLAKIAAGGAGADREMTLMVGEKIAATLELQHAFLSGALGSTPLTQTQRTVRHYRGKVSANRRRLR